MILDKSKFSEIISEKFNGNYSSAAREFGVTPQHIHKFMKNEEAGAGAELLGGFAAYCFQERLNFWDYVFLPKH